MIRCILLYMVLSIAVYTGVHAQINPPSQFGEFVDISSSCPDCTLPCRVFFPTGFDAHKTYPLFLFLHGSGERGADNAAQLIHGSKVLAEVAQREKVILLFPQCPSDDYWSSVKRQESDGKVKFTFDFSLPPTQAMQSLMNILEHFRSTAYVDTNRLYVAGLSMGGMGTWELVSRMPQTFAAAMPICGGGDPRSAPQMVSVPIWAIHGVQDDIVDPHHSVRMVEAVQRAGGNARITLFPNANHNSWDPAFADVDFPMWMLKRHKN